jgi:hypothetical protein
MTVGELVIHSLVEGCSTDMGLYSQSLQLTLCSKLDQTKDADSGSYLFYSAKHCGTCDLRSKWIIGIEITIV